MTSQTTTGCALGTFLLFLVENGKTTVCLCGRRCAYTRDRDERQCERDRCDRKKESERAARARRIGRQKQQSTVASRTCVSCGASTRCRGNNRWTTARPSSHSYSHVRNGRERGLNNVFQPLKSPWIFHRPLCFNPFATRQERKKGFLLSPLSSFARFLLLPAFHSLCHRVSLWSLFLNYIRADAVRRGACWLSSFTSQSLLLQACKKRKQEKKKRKMERESETRAKMDWKAIETEKDNERSSRKSLN